MAFEVQVDFAALIPPSRLRKQSSAGTKVELVDENFTFIFPPKLRYFQLMLLKHNLRMHLENSDQ